MKLKRILKMKSKQEAWDEMFGEGDFKKNRDAKKKYRRQRNLALLGTVKAIVSFGTLKIGKK